MAKQDETIPEAPASMNNLIDREELLALYRKDLVALESAKANAEREFYVLSGKLAALQDLIAYHESQKAE